MIKTPMFVAALALSLAGMLLSSPAAHAQRVFVSGSGLDTNPCTYAAPCRTFQQAFNTVAAGGEIDVLDPAGYGPLTVSHAISIQAHGFGGITQASSTPNAAAIAISAGSSDAVSINGLLLEGAGNGYSGINVTAAGSVQILNCVIRHFDYGISYTPSNTGSALLVSNTVVSDNPTVAVLLDPSVTNTPVMLSGLKADNNGFGVLTTAASTMIGRSVLSNNTTGIFNTVNAATWLMKSKISGNGTGVDVISGAVYSYDNNDFESNTTDVSGSLASAQTQ